MEEHFELVRKYKVLEDDLDTIENDYKNVLNELDYYKHEYFSMCDLIEHPKAHTSEVLHEGMWVWDDKYKMCNAINNIVINVANELEIEFCFSFFDEDGNEFFNDIFEEGRFFPLTKATPHPTR